jgi:hypothetical protein
MIQMEILYLQTDCNGAGGLPHSNGAITKTLMRASRAIDYSLFVIWIILYFNFQTWKDLVCVEDWAVGMPVLRSAVAK